MASISRFRSSGGGGAFALLASLMILYGLMSALVYSVLHMKFISPLGVDAPIERFSEGRALGHLKVLAHDIGDRQEGREGLVQAGNYIREQLEELRDRAGSDLRILVEESTVNGSFNMLFLGHSITFGYRSHTNVLMRISSVDSLDTDSSVLLNAHFDSPLGSPGASDCGACVASLLELARLIVDSGWIPPQPLIFLFNGAEELFMMGSHGFITTNKWRDTIGAFINVEASGSGGPDLVTQSGPGAWPSFIYAKSAVYPMANSAAQDVFTIVPGDTDYRIFAQDFGNIPGLDIILIIGCYYYHTSFDTVERLMPGSIQARGDNLFSVTKAFVDSLSLENARKVEVPTPIDKLSYERAVYFDYLSLFMVFYPKKIAIVLHSLPLALFLFLPLLVQSSNKGLHSLFLVSYDFMKGIFLHFFAIILGVIVPVVFAVLRLVFSSYAMSWYARPYLAFLMFIPCSLVGLLLPQFVWWRSPVSRGIFARKSSEQDLATEGRFWGAFGYYSLLTVAFLLAGLSGGFLHFIVSISMLIAWIFYRMTYYYGGQSLRSVACYVLPLLPCLTYSVHFGGFLIQFAIERMGMAGTFCPPYGFYMQDIIIAVLTGIVTGWCVGPLVPIVGQWLARSSIMQFLLHLTVLALALSSQFFPYTTDAPKRLLFQHTIVTADLTQIVNSSYDFMPVDANSFEFLFKHSPDAAKQLQIGSVSSYETRKEGWLALTPINFLFSRTLKVPAKTDDIFRQYTSFPYLSTYKPQELSGSGIRRVHLEFDLGSLKEVWVAVLNITGPLHSWSFADNVLSAPERFEGGPSSFICRLSGASHETWTFWLEANSSKPLRVDTAVLEQHLLEETKTIKRKFPDWVDVTAYTSFMSSYLF
ncbi:Endoplasmic reticulum metallopeptidase 1-like protein [Drosera capensis]